MALTAKKVYAILKRQISDMEAKLNSPVRYRGTVATADLLPLNPDIGDMYNIESKSIYGEAGMNVAWNGVVWDTMGAPIDMSLYLTKEEAEAVIQRLVTEYFEKNPVKPGATTEQAQQIEQNKEDITSLKAETSSLKEDIGNLKDVTFDVSVNMLNTEDSDLQLNKRFANLTSSYIMDANNFIISGYIPCTPGNIIRAKLQYQGSNIHTFAFYDASKKYLSQIGYMSNESTRGLEVTVPENAYYARLCCYTYTNHSTEGTWLTVDMITVNNPIPSKFIPYGQKTIKDNFNAEEALEKANSAYNKTDNSQGRPEVTWNNPFLYDGNVSLVKYMEQYANAETIDYAVIECGVNDLIVGISNYDTIAGTTVDRMRSLVDIIHSQYPNCKIFCVGQKYANNIQTSINALAFNRLVINLNKGYEDLCKNTSYSSFCTYIDIALLFDSIHFSPYKMIPIYKGSEETVRVITDWLHPNNAGFYEIAEQIAGAIAYTQFLTN